MSLCKVIPSRGSVLCSHEDVVPPIIPIEKSCPLSVADVKMKMNNSNFFMVFILRIKTNDMEFHIKAESRQDYPFLHTKATNFHIAFVRVEPLLQLFHFLFFLHYY